MSSQAWKNLERKTANAFGGTRHLRGGNFSVSAGDVDLPSSSRFVIECKYRSKLPVLIVDALTQAKSYSKGNDNKIPLAVVKQKNTKGAIVCLSLDNFISLIGDQHDTK